MSNEKAFDRKYIGMLIESTFNDSLFAEKASDGSERLAITAYIQTTAEYFTMKGNFNTHSNSTICPIKINFDFDSEQKFTTGESLIVDVWT